MIKVNDLLDIFEQMLREHWSYELGSAVKGCVDCSGAFVYAYRQLGASIEHGSNTIARKRVGNSVPVSEAKPGYAVFKVKPWASSQSGNRWYNQDPGDVYHIGLMGRDGKVLNAQSTATGFVASPAKSWTFAAPLNAVSYEESVEPLDPNYGNAAVKTSSGSLNVRDSASSSGRIIGKLSSGTRVNIIREETTPWVYAETERGVSGYMSSTYLERDDGTTSPETPISRAVIVRCNGYLNLRATSDPKSKILAEIPLGTTIDIYEKSSKMWRTSYNGISGYVNSTYLDESEEPVLSTGLLIPMSVEDAERLVSLFKNARVIRD